MMELVPRAGVSVSWGVGVGWQPVLPGAQGRLSPGAGIQGCVTAWACLARGDAQGRALLWVLWLSQVAALPLGLRRVAQATSRLGNVLGAGLGGGFLLASLWTCP